MSYTIKPCLSTPTCGDGICNTREHSEDSLSCPYDCSCGEGVCDALEAQAQVLACPEDCGIEVEAAASAPPGVPGSGAGGMALEPGQGEGNDPGGVVMAQG